MTIDEWYQSRQGKSILVPGGGAGNEGQCVQAVDDFIHFVYGIPYIYTPSAKDFWHNFDQLGLGQWFDKITDGSVKKGDVVVFNTQVGPDGHIDVAIQDGSIHNFNGADSNWGNNKTVHLVHHNNPGFVLGSLRLKGGDMEPSDYKVNDGDIENVFVNLLGRKPNDQDLGVYRGKTFKELIYAVMGSDEFKQHLSGGVNKDSALKYVQDNLK